MTITADLIEGYITETSPSVHKIAGVKPEHVQIATQYLKDQVKAPLASEFLTSDLMEYLDGAAGKSRL